VTPKKALLHAHKADKQVRRIFDHVHDKDERYELNLYVVGEEDEPEPDDSSAAGHTPAERSPNQ
jgi:succinate dehydrogenase / fumarate reductase, iron-sulfur subunit